ncbi:zinc finger protein 862-like [Entelurus aequoreus]|uniref:zinc finger protein 862-like n=1 Tax=Entelurus aequoreus TaxID=161455 RepID=UPI002B1D0EB9|nr:zinc finger protein 862-like [Entelurus aequoreus]
MWRFLKPIAKKARTEEEEEEEGGRDANAAKPKPTSAGTGGRKFQTKWLYDDAGKKRDWLTVKNNIMFCTVCTTFGKDKKSQASHFVVGCSSMKVESIISHEGTRNHDKNMKIKQAKSAPLHEAPSVQVLTKLSDVNTQKMKLLFRNAHAIAKKGRPITDYVWQCSLDEKKGLSVGKTYRNRETGKLFVKYIAKAARDKLSSTVLQSPFLSVMVDGSTDRSVKEEELTYVRCCKAGKVEVHFVGIEAVDKADAAHITRAVQNQMQTVCKDWESKLVAVASRIYILYILYCGPWLVVELVLM